MHLEDRISPNTPCARCGRWSLIRWFVSLAICVLMGPAAMALASSPTRAAWTASQKARCTFVAVPSPQFAVRIVRSPATKFGSRPTGSNDAGQQSVYSIRYGPRSCTAKTWQAEHLQVVLSTGASYAWGRGLPARRSRRGTGHYEVPDVRNVSGDTLFVTAGRPRTPDGKEASSRNGHQPAVATRRKTIPLAVLRVA